MIRNMGKTDRTDRVVIGVVALVVSFAFAWGSTVGTVVGIALLAVARPMTTANAVQLASSARLTRTPREVGRSYDA